MYYKIITEYSFFTSLYGKDTDVFNIPNCTIFTAPPNPTHKPESPKCMIQKSCFHFADGAFDTMLWHTRLCNPFYTKKYQIYKIEPIGNIIKSRCIDDLGIYQCGAQQIKIIGKQDTDELYDSALQEYYKFHNKYTNFNINPDYWGKHQTTVFYIKKSYEDSLPQPKYPSIPIDELLSIFER